MEGIATALASVGVGILIGLGAKELRRRLFWRRRWLPGEIKRFFGCEIEGLSIVTRSFVTRDLPDVHLGIAAYIESRDAKYEVIGYVRQHSGFGEGLRQLVSQTSWTAVGPVQHRDVDADTDRSITCVENGIHLIDGPDGRLGAHVLSNPMLRGTLEVEVMSRSEQISTAFIEAVRDHTRSASVYRGKVISIECDASTWGHPGCGEIRFHRLPETGRDDIILPEATMGLIERNTVGFFAHTEILRRSGRSLKRGLLFHGKPGTGKTYTAKWLAQALPGVTVILMSGEHLWLIKECCQMARLLAPSLVIMEDVDLIASERDESRHPMYQVSLHQLLNEMDGLGSDAEVIFILTTNRPDAIEPAIAARPGRIDQAIEFPLPGDDCRRRLFELYGRGLQLELRELDRFIAKTEGASPAFIEELMRKAALVAAEEAASDADPLCVGDSHVETALRELVLGGGELTRNLLGFETGHSGS